MSHHPVQFELKHKRIYQGRLLKRSKYLREWRERWVVLTQHYLVTFINSTSPEITDILDVTSLKSVKSYLNFQQQMTPSAFKLRTMDSQFYFAASDLPQKWSWIVALERLMNFHRAQLSKQNVNPLQYTRAEGFKSLEKYTANQQITQRKEIDQEDALKLMSEQLSEIKLKYRAIVDRNQKLQKQYEQLRNDKEYYEYLQKEEENKGVSFRQNRMRVQEKQFGSRQAMVRSVLELCGEDFPGSGEGDFPILISFLSTIVKIEESRYDQIFQKELRVHSNRDHFLETMIELFGSEEDYQNSSESKLAFLHYILKGNPSLFSFRQLQQIAAILIARQEIKLYEQLKALQTIHAISPIQDQGMKAWLAEIANRDGAEAVRARRILGSI